MSDTVPVHPHRRPARDLAEGMRIAAGFLPLMRAAKVLFAYPHPLYGQPRVFVVYLYDGDTQPTPDEFLADALIPLKGCAVHGRIPRDGCCVEGANYCATCRRDEGKPHASWCAVRPCPRPAAHMDAERTGEWPPTVGIHAPETPTTPTS